MAGDGLCLGCLAACAARRVGLWSFFLSLAACSWRIAESGGIRVGGWFASAAAVVASGGGGANWEGGGIDPTSAKGKPLGPTSRTFGCQSQSRILLARGSIGDPSKRDDRCFGEQAAAKR